LTPEGRPRRSSNETRQLQSLALVDRLLLQVGQNFRGLAVDEERDGVGDLFERRLDETLVNAFLETVLLNLFSYVTYGWEIYKLDNDKFFNIFLKFVRLVTYP
jgi:hypothetical protein